MSTAHDTHLLVGADAAEGTNAHIEHVLVRRLLDVDGRQFCSRCSGCRTGMDCQTPQRSWGALLLLPGRLCSRS